MKKTNLFSALILIAVMSIAITGCQNDSSSSDAEAGKDESSITENPETPVPTAENSTAVVDPSLPTTSVEWTAKIHDFGDIPKGDKQKTGFTFKNTGDNPLVIASATAGCGCTVPKKPEEPIAPGAEGEIEVEYNGSGTGKISKNVTVLLNTETGKDILNITANVIGGDIPPPPPQ